MARLAVEKSRRLLPFFWSVKSQQTTGDAAPLTPADYQKFNARDSRVHSDADELLAKTRVVPRSCPSRIRHFSVSQRYDDNDNDNDGKPVKVRWFQQDDDTSRKRRITANEALENDEARAIRAQIQELERELAQMKRGMSPQQLSNIDAAIEQAKAEEDHDGSIIDVEAGARDTPSDVDGLPASVLQDMGIQDTKSNKATGLQSVLILLNLPEDLKPLLLQLNKNLVAAMQAPQDDAVMLQLWKWYIRCKADLPPFASLVPDEAWDILWQSQIRLKMDDKTRAARLRTLLDDMVKGRRSLDSSQRVSYIQYLLEEDRAEEALLRWQNEERELRALGDGQAQRFEDLGVRIHAKAGRLQEAEELALGLMKSELDKTSKSLVPVILAWIERGDEDALKTSWALYIRFRDYIGPNVTMEDYDQIAMAFYRAGRIDVGLAVFKDMMLTGQNSKSDSKESFQKVLGTYGSLQSIASDPSAVSHISLTAMTGLPKKFQNRFFYASWMKKLISMGEVDAAISVIELMYHRGLKPDPKHMNGIIAAWLRSGTTKQKERALQIGWGMIQQRLSLVAKRYQNPRKILRPVTSGTALESESVTRAVPIPAHLQRALPQASIETFSILLQYYERRNMLGYAQELKQNLEFCEIAPNSYFMNHLLYAELRRGNHPAVWELYQQTSRNVRPDLETFACLWDCQKAHLGKVAHKDHSQFPSPRLLFHNMFVSLAKQSGRERDATLESMNEQLYQQIVRCFCLNNDLAGTAVSLYALRDLFGMYPDQATIRMITIQVARLSEGTSAQPRRRRIRFQNAQPNLDKINQALELIAQKRGEELAGRGIDVKGLEEKEQNEGRLYLISQLLELVMDQAGPSGATVQQVVKTAAREMGVEGINMDDHMSAEASLLSSLQSLL
ncbi:hypothetical protein MMC25_004633 [Agyrium rufum]|nr:hypothetical protein [Agyrium rufum]